MSYDVTLFLQLILLPTTKTHNNRENMTTQEIILVTKLRNVLNFIISFFEDDENIQPIKKELQSVIEQLSK